LERASCAEPASVRFPLQTGEIIKQWRRLRRRFAFFRRDPCFTETTVFNFVRGDFVPNPLATRLFVANLCKIFAKPPSAISAGFDFKIGKYLEERARFEAMNFLLPLRQDRQGGGLHATHRRQLEATGLVIERSHGARAVYSNQPVAFRSADGGLRQRNHFLI